MILKKSTFALSFFAFLVSFSTYGNVLDHLVKIENKTSGHCIKGIDFIYMINLDVRPEKYEKAQNELSPYGIKPFRFSAINGWELPSSVVQDIGIKYKKGMDCGFMATYFDENLRQCHETVSKEGRTYFVHCIGLGAIGCYLSHLSILKDAYDSGYETIWVMEDDIKVLKNPRIISQHIESLDKLVKTKLIRNWDILYTDVDFVNSKGLRVPAAGMARHISFKHPNFSNLFVNKKISKDFRAIGARFGTHSMVIRRSGIKKILDFANQYSVFLPIDMEIHLHPDINLYTVLDDVVGNESGAPSDNGSPHYKKRK
jgi:GR25 family glycosyltransferase involved in LPS biosynthesis